MQSLMQMHLESLPTYKDRESMKEMSERCLLRFTRMSCVSKIPRETPKSWPQCIYRAPKQELLAHWLGQNQGHWTLCVIWSLPHVLFQISHVDFKWSQSQSTPQLKGHRTLLQNPLDAEPLAFDATQRGFKWRKSLSDASVGCPSDTTSVRCMHHRNSSLMSLLMSLCIGWLIVF